MGLDREYIELLSNIQEGISDTHQLQQFIDNNSNKIKIMMEKLEELKTITITRKYDEYYKEDYWDAKITEKGKDILNGKI